MNSGGITPAPLPGPTLSVDGINKMGEWGCIINMTRNGRWKEEEAMVRPYNTSRTLGVNRGKMCVSPSLFHNMVRAVVGEVLTKFPFSIQSFKFFNRTEVDL